MADAPTAVLDWDGPLSPPRHNGEIVFETVWESRLFGMTMALYESGAFRWEEFRDRLIAAIAAWERDHSGRSSQSSALSPQPSVPIPYRYWDCWLEAFEQLVAAKGLCPADALGARVAEFAARPHGHDHAPR